MRRPGPADRAAVAALSPTEPDRLDALLRDIADPSAPVDALLAADGSGLAIWHLAYDAEAAVAGGYLCVCRAAAGAGSERALLAAVCGAVSAQGGRFLVWHGGAGVRVGSEGIGVALAEGPARRLDGAAFASLARGGS